MEMQRKSMARAGDRLSELPDSLLIYILSMLKWYGKELVRTSLLSKRWRFLWKSVPVSLEYRIPHFDDEKKNLDYMASIHRELHYWRFCEKIQTFRVNLYQMKKGFVKDADLLVLFATTLANVEEFSLESDYDSYQFPGFAYKSTSLRHLEFNRCELNPFGSVSWTSLQSLSIRDTTLTDGTMEKCLSVLELEGWQCPLSTRKHLKICSALNQLDFPGVCNFLQSSVGLETLVIDWMWNDYTRVDLLSLFTKKDERNRRLEMNNFNVPLLNLKTIQINFHITLSGNTFVLSLVKYFLKNATALEKFILVAKSKGRDVAQDYAKMEQEILNFPRSSPHASVVFSY